MNKFLRVAIKILDTELVARFGADMQKQRIEREFALKDITLMV